MNVGILKALIDKVFNFGVLDACVVAKLLKCDELVLFFPVVFFHFAHEVLGIAFAFSGDELNVI